MHKKRKDNWAEKELDDIRENIIAYEDEGGGEGDAGYDLHVLRQMFQPQPEGDNYMRGPGELSKIFRNSNINIQVLLKHHHFIAY